MTSVGDTGSISSPTQRSRGTRGFTSRFGSLFSSRSSPIDGPQIELDEPLRTYSRGDLVKGKVVLNVNKPLGITHLTVSLFGYLEVFKHHSKSRTSLRANPARVVSGKGKRWVTEYYGDGFASLFEHETPLCGEGRLDPNVYHFQFELPFPSDRELPTSIEFERGVVAYGIAATITRPVTMGATMTISHPVKYRQKIDVAALREPKPRIVTVEPVSSHSRPSVVRRLTSTSTGDERSSSRLSSISRLDQPRRAVANISSANDDRPQLPGSPLPSASSSMSADSGNAKGVPEPAEPQSSRSSQEGGATVSQASSGGRTITASVELSRAGALPGDTVPLRVHIQHTKKVRSLYGVIVTLYRQARVDMHPNLPVATDDHDPKQKKNEDYYPRSKSGLGGLSLSAAGSSQVWRKDLFQSISPLYIDDHTMTAEVRSTVRVPDDAFTTLANAPGDMIAFKYFVEVIIDINGKMAGRQNSSTADVSVSSIHSAPASIHQGQAPEEARPQGLAVESGAFYYPSVAKGAVKVQCDLVIGSHDSGKLKGKKTVQTTPQPATGGAEENSRPPQSKGGQLPHPMTNSAQDSDDFYNDNEYDERYFYDESYDQRYYDSRQYDYFNSNSYGFYENERPQGYASVPPPDVLSDSDLSEKERLRRAEQTLLPSRPPGAGEFSPTPDAVPSAPFLPEEMHYQSPDSWRTERSSSAHMPPVTRVSSRATPTASPRMRLSSVFNAPSTDIPAPSYSAAAGEQRVEGSGQALNARLTDDKQELERRRLQELASVPEAGAPAEGAAGSATAHSPSAPPISTVEDGVESLRFGAGQGDVPSADAVRSECEPQSSASALTGESKDGGEQDTR